MIEKFHLPDYLENMISSECLSFGEELITLPGILRLAWCAVDESFRRTGKFTIESPMPDPKGVIPSTKGSLILEQFRTVGLEGTLRLPMLP